MIELKRKEIIQYLLDNGKNKKWSKILKQFSIEVNSLNLKKVSDYWRYTQRTGNIIPEKSLKDVKTNLNAKLNNKEAKVLIYDIETTFLTAEVWRSGKQYIRHGQLLNETKIITIAYKWLHEDNIECITWDNVNKDDKELLNEFSTVFNQADLVVGYNNNLFDQKIVYARCAKHDITINTFTKSLDLMKECRKLFSLPSYSMKYIAQYFNLPNKLEHEGMQMWRDIQQEYNQKVSDIALDKMVQYNLGDIVTTEAIYDKLIKYSQPTLSKAAVNDLPKYFNPDTAIDDAKLHKVIYTKAGTSQYIMITPEGRKFKISKTEYKKYLNNK